jgi:hypothetical protein
MKGKKVITSYYELWTALLQLFFPEPGLASVGHESSNDND